jgi:uncharacterized membrane protein SpoIIM required for sporulation
VGVSHFNREELLGQEFDTLNIRWMFWLFKDTFWGNSRNLGEWYRRQIVPTLRDLRSSILVMAVLFLAAIWFGYSQAQAFELPSEWVNLNEGGFGVSQQEGLLSLVSTETVFLLWFHNIRAMLIGSFAGMVTFGILGVLVFLLPIMVISFLLVPFISVGIPAWKYLVGLVLPHGIFELPAILLVGATILHIGVGLATPSKRESIADTTIRSLAVWAKILVGLVLPLMLLAATMEALVTPRLAIWLFSQ